MQMQKCPNQEKETPIKPIKAHEIIKELQTDEQKNVLRILCQV